MIFLYFSISSIKQKRERKTEGEKKEERAGEREREKEGWELHKRENQK